MCTYVVMLWAPEQLLGSEVYQQPFELTEAVQG